MPGFDRFYIIIASIITTAMFVTLGTGCAQQRVTLTDPLVYARSTDELHVGWVQQTASGKAVVSIDAKIRSKPYDEIGLIYFSPDNQRVAYSVKSAGKWRVMIDEAPGPEFDEISIIDVAFSPDSKRLAYAALRDNKWYAILDDKSILDDGHDSIRNLTFSPDNRRVAYIASNNDKQAFVMDGTIGPLFEKVKSPVWSPDGSSFAYIAMDKGNKFIVLNGEVGPRYDEVATPVFSFSGRHFAYGAMKGGKSLVVTDGKEGPSFEMGKPIDTIKFAPSDERLGYIVKKVDMDKWVVIIDGKEVAAYAYIAGPSLIFNPDGKGYAYAAAARNSPMMLVDEKGEGPGFNQIIEPVYSPDGNRIAYGALMGNELFLVTDGPAVPEPEFKDIFNLSFSPDGKHLMYKAIGKDSQFVVLDGQASPAYDRVYKPAFTTNGVEYLAEREKDGFLWRGLIPYAPENKDMKSAKDAKIVETKLGWLPTKESMTHECALCEKQKESIEEQE
jgi:hypothetical protein